MSIEQSGTVKWFNEEKGYGFIQPKDGGADVFVHVTAVKDSGLSPIEEGDELLFDIQENRGKECAGNLRRI